MSAGRETIPGAAMLCDRMISVRIVDVARVHFDPLRTLGIYSPESGLRNGPIGRRLRTVERRRWMLKE